jgi:hypothetical protein
LVGEYCVAETIENMRAVRVRLDYMVRSGKRLVRLPSFDKMARL